MDVWFCDKASDVGAWVAEPHGTDECDRPFPTRARHGAHQGHVDLQLGDGADEHQARLRKRGDAAVHRALLERLSEARSVGDVRHQMHPLGGGQCAHALGQARGAAEDAVGANGEARLGDAERVRVDPRVSRDVVDAVVNHQLRVERVEQTLGLWDIRPQNRTPDVQLLRRMAHERRKQPRVEAPYRPAAV
jgi:hypothetical protein